tara:strand:+ start:1560 stop:1790 length:231 start_codon:yes stop_codon:yes gene_type:complete
MNNESSIGNKYNNADSFAIAFDEAWNNCNFENNKNLNTEEKLEEIFNKIQDHPYLIDNPKQAKNIAYFRIKLLGLS